jgi:sphingomyelin phosphodiesterase acid-like 3
MKKTIISTLVLTIFVLFCLAVARTSCAFSAGRATGHILLVTDIHFDPLADPAIVKQLIAAPVSQWQELFARSKQNGYAHAPADANYPLLKSALSAAIAQGPFDFVIASGDYLRHGFLNAFIEAGGTLGDFPGFATKTAVFVIDTLQTTFGVPVYAALGNNDSASGDYCMEPGSAFLSSLADSLEVLAIDPEATVDFRTAGFYELPHPTFPNEEIVVLNTVLWSRSYSILGAGSSDPGAAEMQWLAWKLYQARTLAHKVILVMHIPPGIDAYASCRRGNDQTPIQFWQDRYFTQFLELMQKYGDIVNIALAGHTHMDDFRVLGDTGNASPVVFRITPSISPTFGNNPAFSVLNYDGDSGNFSDIATYYLNLADGGNSPQWALEYRFPSAYGYSSLNATNLGALSASIHDDPEVRRTFAKYYAVSASSPITCTNWLFYSCAETRFTPTDYRRCTHGP